VNKKDTEGIWPASFILLYPPFKYHDLTDQYCGFVISTNKELAPIKREMLMQEANEFMTAMKQLPN
jgi:hypothetical protein